MLTAFSVLCHVPWESKTILSCQACCSSAFSGNQYWAPWSTASWWRWWAWAQTRYPFFSTGSSCGSINFQLDSGQRCFQANLWPGKAAQPGKPWSAWRRNTGHRPEESVCSRAAPWTWAGDPLTQSGSVAVHCDVSWMKVEATTP